MIKKRKSFFGFHQIIGICLLGSVPLTSTVAQNSAVLASNPDISINAEVSTSAYIGEPFEYKIRVIYKPESVKPDFSKLIRGIRFVPLEQLNLSRPSITESTLASGENEYLLSYPVFAINVVPHNTYVLDPVKLSYRNLKTNENLQITIQPGSVDISAYYPKDISGIPFQPLKGTLLNYQEHKRMAIALGAIIFLTLGSLMIFNSARQRIVKLFSRADVLRNQYEQISANSPTDRQSVLLYERIYLSLVSCYMMLTARDFWIRDPQTSDPFLQQNFKNMKHNLLAGYSVSAPESVKIKSIRELLDSIFNYVEPDSVKERLKQFTDTQGTVKQRIANRKTLFIGGTMSSLLALLLLVFFVKPSIWMDSDIGIYNNWINSLPDRMFDESRDSEMSSMDVEMLVNFSEIQKVFEQLKSQQLKGKYLYNFGTIVSKAYIAILSGADATQQEEIEAAAPPSFDFPVQLLSNAARLYPHDEDTRRNLELAIMWRENEDRKDSDKAEGETGPPLPGFSRDLSPLLF